MNLRFLLLLSFLIFPFLSCKKDKVNVGNDKVYLKLDLTNKDYNSLNAKGGILYIENVLVVRVDDANFAAVTQYCDGENCITEYNADQHAFKCPCTAVTYNFNGVSPNDNGSIKSYTTLLEGVVLHVFE
jgi:hypothetical protein